MTGRRPGALLRAGGALVAVLLAYVVVDGWRAFGHRPEGARLARMQRSPQWHGGHFDNPQPLRNDGWGMIRGLLQASPERSPTAAVAVDRVEPARLASPPASGLRVTWLGHSSLLLEIDGRRVLTDPVWGERASPLDGLGPQRWYAPLVALADLPPIDAVLISHDHYDHLDAPTITAMKGWQTTFVVPLGVGAHLAYWGVPEARIVELDWWEPARVGDLTITAAPARHASGRALLDVNRTLWASFSIAGPSHRAYFSGDTGFFPALADIGARLGPFDVTLIEAGQYDPSWPDWHLGPEQAVKAHRLLRGRVMIPIHWALFGLAYHGWTEPIERVLAEAARTGVTLLAPRPGQSVEPSAAAPAERWWPALPWLTAEQRPVVATGIPP